MCMYACVRVVEVCVCVRVACGSVGIGVLDGFAGAPLGRKDRSDLLGGVGWGVGGGGGNGMTG